MPHERLCDKFVTCRFPVVRLIVGVVIIHVTLCANPFLYREIISLKIVWQSLSQFASPCLCNWFCGNLVFGVSHNSFLKDYVTNLSRKSIVYGFSTCRFLQHASRGTSIFQESSRNPYRRDNGEGKNLGPPSASLVSSIWKEKRELVVSEIVILQCPRTISITSLVRLIREWSSFSVSFEYLGIDGGSHETELSVMSEFSIITYTRK